MFRWWEKIKIEIKPYEGIIDNKGKAVYGLHQFLYEALTFKEFNYLKATIELYKGDDPRIFYLLYSYGYQIDDLEIMRKFAENEDKGLMEIYQEINDNDYEIFLKVNTLVKLDYVILGRKRPNQDIDSSEEFKKTNYYKIIKILYKGIYSIDELYELISTTLSDDNIQLLKFLKSLTSYIDIFGLYHPRRTMFDSLVKRYIGLSDKPEQRKLDLEKLKDFLPIYKRLCGERKLFNLMDDYDLRTLDDDLYEILYPKVIEKSWVFDDVDEFLEKLDEDWTDISGPYSNFYTYNVYN